MSSTWHAVLIKCRYEPRIFPYLLALVRVAICFGPQSGYLHPDEFFQSIDVIGGQYFDSQTQKTWEFTTDKPIRCMLIPVLFNKLAFILLSIFTIQPSAYSLLVAPRLVYTFASFIIDFSLYKLCQYYSSRGLWYLPVSIIFQTSFVCLGCLTRTLSNVTETIIFSLLLVVVCQAIRPRFRILFVTPTRSRPAHELVKKSTQLVSSTLIGFLLALGTFNRPTFPCFAFVPMLYWTSESFKRNSYNIHLNLQRVLAPLAIAFALTSFLISAYDTFYYSVEDNPSKIFTQAFDLLTKFKYKHLYDHLATHWIFTPFNFIRFNSNVENLTAFSLHPPYMHMILNIPLAFNVLGLMFYGKLVNLMLGSGVHRLLFSTHRVYALMLLSTLTSTILLSFIPHQEFRFLLPIIVPLAYTFAFNIYASNRLLIIWFLTNLILTYFYSSVHQAGIIKAALDLDPILKSHHATSGQRSLVDVLAFHCYLVPSYQWNIPNSDEYIKFDLQKTHDELMYSADEKFNHALRRNQEFVSAGIHNHLEHIIYIMLPNVHIKQLQTYISQNLTSNLTNLEIIRQYAPHFTGEDISDSVAHLREFGWRSWRDAFGFSLLKTSIQNLE